MAKASNDELEYFPAVQDFSVDSISNALEEILRINFRALEHCQYSRGCSHTKEHQELISRTTQVLEEIQEKERYSSTILSRQSSFDFSSRAHYGKDNLLYGSSASQDQHPSSSKLSRSTLSKYPSLDNQSVYKVKKGYLLLIVNVWFDGRLAPRNGAAEEGENVKKLFETFGFYVYCLYNVKRDEIRESIQELTKPGVLDDFDCFAFVMMSHGSKEGIFGTDNLPEDFEAIADEVKGDKCKSLIGKPKLFFFQSCRGTKMDRGQELYGRGKNAVMDGKNRGNEAVRIPTDSDILIVCATTQGQLAHKDIVTTVDGRVISKSWLFEAILQVFSAYAEHEDLMSMMSRINSHVSMMGNEHRGVQIPCQLSTLTKKVYFQKSLKEMS